MKKIPLPFKVPRRMNRICLFFTEDEKASVVLKIGSSYFTNGQRGRKLTPAEESLVLDWLALEMTKLRMDLGNL